MQELKKLLNFSIKIAQFFSENGAALFITSNKYMEYTPLRSKTQILQNNFSTNSKNYS